MTTRVVGATLVAGALLISYGSSTGSAPTKSDASDAIAMAAGGTTSLTFVTHERKSRSVDLKPVGGKISAGDFFWSAGLVYNDAHSQRLGRYVARCEATPGGFSCDYTTNMRGQGKLYMSQTVVGRNAKGIILGGTGRFAGVRGQMDTSPRRNGHRFDENITIELIR